MNDELLRGYQRWRRAEDEGRDDDADAAFAEVFRGTMPQAPIAPAFMTRTLEAVSAAAERDRRRATRTRRVLIPLGVAAAGVAAYYSVGLITAALTATVLWFLDVLVGGVVGAAGGARAGSGLWDVLTAFGRAAGAFISSPTVTLTILAIHGVAITALLALQRLLGSDRESFR